jgi:ABC-type sugar transport system ATPase subunit
MTMGDRVAVMSEGVLEQIGAPRTVYEEPANVFVAGFIGSPAMSFARVQATRNGDGLTLSRGELSLILPSVRLPDGVPVEVIAGIRPEHCHLWRDGLGLLGPIAGRTAFVELLGRETLIGVEAAQELQFTVLADPDAAAKPGDEIRFGVEPGRLHLFDAETERALSIV